MELNDFIKPLSELEQIVKRLKEQGKIIVTTNGVFDILHYGHIKSLVDAKKMGNILIVGINSDVSVKKLNKGPGRPFYSQKDRALIIAALGCVDYVFFFDDKRPTNSLARLAPNIHFKGEEYKNFCPEVNVVEQGGGKVVFGGQRLRSTSNLIERIIKVWKLENNLN